MSTTLDPMDGVEVDPEVVALIERIDAALRECSSRSLVSANEMTDMLLDIRAAASLLTGG